MTIEEQLKEMILANYGTVRNFSTKIGMPNSTLATILTKGVNKATIDSIFTICHELGISSDALAEGRIVPYQEAEVKEASLMVDHIKRSIDSVVIDGEYLTEGEMHIFFTMLDLSIEMIRRLRK